MLRLRGMGGGGDGYLQYLSSAYSLVGYNTDSHISAHKFDVPVLADPSTYTVEEFAALPAEAADGYAQQVVDTWRSIQESERDHPSFTGQPLVVRAAAVLPVPPVEGPDAGKFEVDFLPQLGMTRADVNGQVKRAYDVRLLVKGNENVGANYVKFDSLHIQARQPVYADAGGRRAPLTVQRGAAVSEALPSSVEDLGLTPRSQGAIALYLAPHAIKERSLPEFDLLDGYGDANAIFGGGATRGGVAGGLGAASIDVGAGSSWAGSVKKPESLFDRVAPEMHGRPIIVSLQLLTFER